MKSTALLINTARGGIINEEDLYFALKNNIIAAAASDVFETEPYNGKLLELVNFIATPHIGAATKETRIMMEVEAVEEAIRFKNGKPLKNEMFG
jgi:D-3-phosphoglycerate dehydrogenase